MDRPIKTNCTGNLKSSAELSKLRAEKEDKLQEQIGKYEAKEANKDKKDESLFGILRRNATEAITEYADKKILKEIQECVSVKPTLKEALSANVHRNWANWEKYRARALNLDNLQLWNRKSATPYTELTEQEKQSDRVIADEILEILKDYGIKI